MFNNSTDEIYVEHAHAHIAVLLTLYVLVSIIGIIGNVNLIAALALSGASRLGTPQLLSACATDLLVCAASAPLAATRAARIQHLPCHVSYYIESLPVAASTFSLVTIAANRCCAVQRGRSSLCSRAYLAVTLVAALLLGAITIIATCLFWPPLAAAHAIVTYCILVVIVTQCHWTVLVKTHHFVADSTCSSWGIAPTSSSNAPIYSRHYSS